MRLGRSLGVGAALVAAVGCAAAYALGGGGHIVAQEFSPDRTYRLDWATVDRADRWLHSGMSNPQRVELHEAMSGRLVGTGEVIDADAGGNGHVAWLMKDIGVVSAGPGAQFLRVPPLSPDGRALPIDKDFGGGTSSTGH